MVSQPGGKKPSLRSCFPLQGFSAHPGRIAGVAICPKLGAFVGGEYRLKNGGPEGLHPGVKSPDQLHSPLACQKKKDPAGSVNRLIDVHLQDEELNRHVDQDVPGNGRMQK
jgi:hypothetical protein